MLCACLTMAAWSYACSHAVAVAVEASDTWEHEQVTAEWLNAVPVPHKGSPVIHTQALHRLCWPVKRGSLQVRFSIANPMHCCGLPYSVAQLAAQALAAQQRLCNSDLPKSAGA